MTNRRHTIISGLLLIALLAGIGVSSALAEQTTATRLAIVDGGASEHVPAIFQDLLVVALGKHPEIALLERTEINRLLHEQALGMTTAGQVGSENAVKAGRLWGADAFLILEMLNGSKPENALRIRLVDARYGFKLWDAVIPLRTEAAATQRTIDTVARLTSDKLALINRPAKDLLIVGVTTISSEEISRNQDWLADDLQASLEAQLAIQPGVLLVERSRTDPLTNERELVTGLPEALRASAVIVDGSYLIKTEKGAQRIVLNFRYRRSSHEAAKSEIEGSLADLPALCNKAAQFICAHLGLQPDPAAFDLKEEADLLVAEAKYHLAMHEHHLVFSPAQAALALVPNDCDALIVMANACLGQKVVGPLDKSMHDSLVELKIINQAAPDCRLGLLAHNVMYRTLITFSGNLGRSQPVVYQPSEPRGSPGFPEWVDVFWSVWARWDHDTPTNSPFRKVFLDCTEKAYPLYKSTDQLIAISQRVLSESLARSHGQTPAGLDGFVPVAGNKLICNEQMRQKLLEYLSQLQQNTNPVIRSYAAKVFQQITGPASPKKAPPTLAEARAHIETELQALKTKPSLHWDMTVEINSLIDHRYFSAHENVQLVQFVMSDLLDKKLFQVAPALWANVVCNGNLMYAGEPDVMIVLLHRCLAALQQDHQESTDIARDRLKGALAMLKDSTPAVVVKGALTRGNTVSAVRELAWFADEFRQPNTDKKLRKPFYLAANDKQISVVYTIAQSITDGYGVLSLDPVTLRPLATQETGLYPTPNSTVSAGDPNPLLFVTTDGHNILMSHPEQGIAVMPQTYLTDTNGPTLAEIISVSEMDGKLYLLTRTPAPEDDGKGYFNSSVIEIDRQTGVSKVLLSNRTKFPKLPVDGKIITGLTADPRHHVLWGILGWTTLFQYSPRENQAKIMDGKWDSLVSPTHIRCDQDRLLIWVLEYVFLMDLTKTTPDQKIYRQDKSKPGFFNQLPTCLTVVGENVYGLYRHDLLRFQKGSTAPEYPFDRLLPKELVPEMNLVDLARTPQGLLVMTTEALYLIPNNALQPTVASGIK